MSPVEPTHLAFWLLLWGSSILYKGKLERRRLDYVALAANLSCILNFLAISLCVCLRVVQRRCVAYPTTLRLLDHTTTQLRSGPVRKRGIVHIYLASTPMRGVVRCAGFTWDRITSTCLIICTVLSCMEAILPGM